MAEMAAVGGGMLRFCENALRQGLQEFAPFISTFEIEYSVDLVDRRPLTFCKIYRAQWHISLLLHGCVSYPCVSLMCYDLFLLDVQVGEAEW